MKTNRLLLAFVFAVNFGASAQNSVGIGTETPNPNAVLQLISPTNDQGFLIPTMTTAERTATTFTDNLSDTDEGLMVYDTDANTFFYWENSTWSSLAQVQDLQLIGHDLTITNNGASTTINLAPYLDNSDDQTVTDFSINNTTRIITLTLEGGNTSTIDLSTVLTSADTDDQALSLSGDMLSLTSGGNVDLTPYLDNTDDQQITDLSINGSNIMSITLENGNTATLDLSGLTGAGGTDDQQITGLSLNGSNVLSITIEDGNTATVDLSPLTGGVAVTDDQALSLEGTTLSLEDGGSVELSGFLDNTDNQSLSLSDNLLFLSNGGSVDLSPFQNTNTDDQQLSLSSNILSLEDGGTVNLAPYLDDTDDQTATQVPVTPGNGMTSTNVQSALNEHQTDINSINTSITSINSTNSTQNSRLNTLEATRTGFLMITGSDFQPFEDSKTQWLSNYNVSYGDNNSYIQVQSTDLTPAFKLYSKLNLPNESRISQITVVGQTSDGTYEFAIYSYGFGADAVGKGEVPKKIENTSVSVSGAIKDFDSGSINESVDTSSQQYYILISSNGLPAMRLHQVRIQYEYNY